MNLARVFTLLTVCGLTLPAAAEEAAPIQLLGLTQIDQAFTAYLRENGGQHVFTLSEGEVGNGWRIIEVLRGSQQEVLRICLQRGQHSIWLGVAGVAAPAPASSSSLLAGSGEQVRALIDIPVSARGVLHDQLLHRSRTRHKPQARAAQREVSDLDPFPTKLSR